MSYVLGVTGGIGSGKTAVTDRLASYGIEIIDADIIARQVVEKGTPALKTIEQHFGSDVLLDSGELDRHQLRHIIFNNPEEKFWLESILHPIIRQTITDKINTSKPPYCVLVAPLLLEGNLHTLANKLVVIDCSEAIQIKRASQRDDTKKSDIKKIIEQQMSREEKRQKADTIITNEGSLAELYKYVDALHQQLIKDIKNQ